MNLGIGTVRVGSTYRFECFDKYGELKWVEETKNLVVTVGLNHILDVVFKSGTQIATWYCGLIDNAGFSAIAAADTMASHAGWAEATGYTEGTRPTFTAGTVSGGSVDNSAAKAAFSINGTATLKGAFLTSNNTKGGTTGTLYGAAAFAATRAVESGDTVNLTVTASLTSS